MFYAEATGLEPAISGLTGRRDNHLRYASIVYGSPIMDIVLYLKVYRTLFHSAVSIVLIGTYSIHRKRRVTLSVGSILLLPFRPTPYPKSTSCRFSLQVFAPGTPFRDPVCLKG